LIACRFAAFCVPALPCLELLSSFKLKICSHPSLAQRKILKDRITPGTAKAGKIKEMMEDRFYERAVCDRGVCERVVSV
jgi:hypothetical protein